MLVPLLNRISTVQILKIKKEVSDDQELQTPAPGATPIPVKTEEEPTFVEPADPLSVESSPTARLFIFSGLNQLKQSAKGLIFCSGNSHKDTSHKWFMRLRLFT